MLKKKKIIAFKFMLSMRQKLFWHMFSMAGTVISAHSASIGNFFVHTQQASKVLGV
jgi:hypothetical protein